MRRRNAAIQTRFVSSDDTARVLGSPGRDHGREAMADAMEIPYAAAGNDVKAPDAPGDDPAAPVADFAQKYSRLSASDLARVVSLQARFRGNARRARLMKSRLSSAHAAGGAFAIFGLPDANEQLITVIPCSLGSSSLVGAGNLYVFSKHVGFHRPNGWTLWGPHKAITLLLPLDHVATVRVKEEYVTAPGVTVRMRNGDDHWFGGMWSPVAASDAVWTAWKARAEHRASLALAARNALVSTRDVSELTKADLQIRSLRACLKDLEADAKRNSDAASALANAQARSERLKDEIELLSASITRLAAEHAEQRDLRVAEEVKARELKLELEEERDLRRRAERKAADLAAECEEHRCRAEEHRAAREADARRADEARTRCADVELRGEEVASSLRVDLERRDIELARVTSRLAETTQTLETERGATAAHAATAEARLVERDAATSERDSLRKKLAAAEESAGELDAKLAQAEAKLIAADAMNAELRAEADAAKKRAEALEKDLHRARGEAERARAAVKEGADEWKEAMAACTAAERDAAAARGAEALARETADKSRVALEESRARERAAREALADARVRLERSQSEANESVAAAEEKAKTTALALAQERERVEASEAEASKLAAKLEDADADVDRLRDAVERQKQETYYLYTQYANCANQLEETKAALEREQEEVVRLHQSFAASKLALSSAAGSGASLGGWYGGGSPGVSAGSVNAPAGEEKNASPSPSPSTTPARSSFPNQPPSPELLFPSLGPGAFAEMTPSPTYEPGKTTGGIGAVATGGADSGSPGTPEQASPEAGAAVA